MPQSEKKSWVLPELIALVRSRPEEAVLTGCKVAGGGGGGARRARRVVQLRYRRKPLRQLQRARVLVASPALASRIAIPRRAEVFTQPL